MAQLAAWILEEAKGEPIQCVVIGRKGWRDEDPEYDSIRGKLLSWEAAEPMLRYEFNDGYGGVECHAIVAWTASRVIFVSQYDGSTNIESVPRNPCEHMPGMPGG